jgi:sigma-B regulation protein RsbU (phosphoserine phosphatase)
VFATAFYGIIDTAAATLIYANGGHPSPLLLRDNTRSVESLAFANPEPAAGLVEGFAYTTQTVAFRVGDTLLAYTDGLFEASDDDGKMFGEARLRAFLAEKRGLSGTALIDRLISEVVTFTGRRDFDDDICALTIESTGKSCALRPAVVYEI